MKNYSLRYLALGLLCALVTSTSVLGSAEPERPPVTNTTWGQALKKSGQESASQAIFWLKYFKLPSLAFNYAIPTWGISRFFNTYLADTEQTAHGLAVGCAVSAISLRYKKQIVEACGDEDTGDAYMAIAPVVGFFLPTKIACCAGLALVAALQSKEWLAKRKITLLAPSKPTAQVNELVRSPKKITYPQIAMLGALSAASMFISLKAGNAFIQQTTNFVHPKSNFLDKITSLFVPSLFGPPRKAILNNQYFGDTSTSIISGGVTALAGIVAKTHGEHKKTDDAKMSLLVPTTLITPPTLVSAYLLGSHLLRLSGYLLGARLLFH